jgi:DNA-binding CsgD family transcriptional regulator
MDRAAKIEKLWKSGKTLPEIAQLLGISKSRVVQIRRRAAGRCPLCGSKDLETQTLCARHAKGMRDRASRVRNADREAYNRRGKKYRDRANRANPKWIARQEQIAANKARREAERAAQEQHWQERTERNAAALIEAGGQQNLRIARRLMEGDTYAEIGRCEGGVTPQRINQIIRNAVRRVETGDLYSLRKDGLRKQNCRYAPRP